SSRPRGRRRRPIGQPPACSYARIRKAISPSPSLGLRNRSAVRSASASVGRCVFARGILANTEASQLECLLQRVAIACVREQVVLDQTQPAEPPPSTS